MRRIMRITFTIGCALILVSSATAQGRKKGGKQGGRPGSAEGFVSRMLQFDKNKDGKLTKAEITDERLQRLIDRADKNKDGSVTRAELTAFFESTIGQGGRGGFGGKKGGRGGFPGGRGGFPGGGRGGFMRMLPVMKALDADGNGEISEKEMKNAVNALKSLDKNKDGKLSAEELRPNFGGFGPGGRGGFGRPGGRPGGAEGRPRRPGGNPQARPRRPGG